MKTPINTKERRTARRFDYDQAAIVLAQGEKHRAVVRSISQMGVYFELAKELRVEEIVQIGWKDSRVGYIKGGFAITIIKPSDDTQIFYYHARFFKLDESSKKNTLALLNVLNQPQSDPVNISLQEIQNVFALDQRVFQAFEDDPSSLPKHVHQIITDISDEELQIARDPQTPLEKSFQKLMMYTLQAQMLWRFLKNTQSIAFDDMEYCLDYILYLMHEIAALEQTSGFAEPVHTDEVHQDDLEHKQRLELNRPIVITSNKAYEFMNEFRIFCDEQRWEEVVKADETHDLGLIHSKSLEVVSVFENKFEVSYDENSYGEAVLARAMQSPRSSLKDSIEPDDIQFAPSKLPKFRHIVLVIFGVIAITQVYVLARGINVVTSEFEDQLAYPIEIERIETAGNGLEVFVDSSEWVVLDARSKENIKEKTQAFIQNQSRYKAVFVFESPYQIAFMVRKESQRVAQ